LGALNPRLYSVDLLRGVVMVIMALDHARDLHADAALFDPTDLTQTNVALFLTRWVTHFCASVFVFLAGTGAYLSTARGKTRNELALFLVTRGLWLIVLELIVINFANHFDITFRVIGAAILWALGWSMIVLAGLIYLPLWAVTVFGVVMIAFHNLLDVVRSENWGFSGHLLWSILHRPAQFKVTNSFEFHVDYPLVPWIGVMAAGYGFGTLLLLERRQRQKYLLGLGLALTLALVIIRGVNLYGDPVLWSV
jgi:uncharacterized membrane protein